MFPPLLADWTFGLASGLLAVGAVAPILIHLWNRQQFQRVRWAAMRQLLDAMQKHAQRFEFEQWLLLAVRVLILLLAALALTDPSFSCRDGGLDSSLARRPREHTVLVLDGSFSMAWERQGQTLWEQAKQAAVERVRAAVQGDAFTLVVMEDPPRTIIGEPAFASDDVIAELEALRLRHTSAALAPALDAALDCVRTARQSREDLQRHRIVVLSDLGANTWQALSEPAVQERLTAEEVQWEVVPLDRPDAGNLAATRLAPLDPYVVAGELAAFEATIENYAGTPRDKVSATFWIDGEQVEQKLVDLPADGPATVAFTHRFEYGGQRWVEVRVPDDPLPLDNRRCRIVSVRDALRVLCVEGAPRSAYFVARALRPDEASESRILPETVLETALLEVDLSQYDAVALTNVARVGADEAAVLRDFVDHGGGLLLFLGDQVRADSYNAALFEDEARRLLPGRLLQRAGGDDLSLDPLDYQHPIVAPYRGFESAGLLSTPIWTYLQVEPTSAAETALAIGGGDPLILTEEIGRGRVVLFTTAASTESVVRGEGPPRPWTWMPKWSSFGPLVQESLAWSLAQRDAGQNVTVGEPLAIRLPGGGVREPRVAVEMPDGERRWTTLDVAGNALTGAFEATWRRGVYTAESNEAAVSRFAVNLPVAESDPERLEAAQLPPAMQASTAPTVGLGSGQPVATEWELFRWLLAAVFGLLLVELALAWFFGSRRR